MLILPVVLIFAVGYFMMVTGVRLDAVEKACGRKAVYGKLGIACGAFAFIVATYLILFEL